MTVIIAEALKKTEYRALNGRPLYLPQELESMPDREALDAHRNQYAATLQQTCFAGKSLWTLKNPLSLSLVTEKLRAYMRKFGRHPKGTLVRDHRGTIRVTRGQGLALVLDGPVWLGHSFPTLLGSFPLDTLAALRYKTDTGYS